MPVQPISFPQIGVSGETGAWRASRPELNRKKCTTCMLCWIYCPEAVISKDNLEIDYTYCKGCGICAEECPVGAMTMIEEAKA